MSDRRYRGMGWGETPDGSGDEDDEDQGDQWNNERPLKTGYHHGFRNQKSRDPADPSFPQKNSDIVDQTKVFGSLADDVLVDEESDSEDEFEYGKAKRGKAKAKGSRDPSNDVPEYMFFDFRKGPGGFPSNVSIIDPSKAESILEKQTADALEAMKHKEKLKEKKEDDDEIVITKSVTIGPVAAEDSFLEGWDTTAAAPAEDSEAPKRELEQQLREAEFEVLNDGSMALIMKPGYRLQLDLSEILEGGDAMRLDR
jgi:hypothetical protein